LEKGGAEGHPIFGPRGQKPRIQKQDGIETKKQGGVEIKKQDGVGRNKRWR